MKVFELTIINALRDLSEKKYSSVELTKECLQAVKQKSEQLHVLLTVDEEGALVQAASADKERIKGATKPLLGIPVVLKDLYTTKNVRTTAGSKIIDDYIPPYDASVVTRLKDAGAVIIGKANQDAWGHGSSGENTDYEPTKNPYDPSRVPGGSSSGSAVALATGMCLTSTGTDTGSSVRLPASYCNIVGIKPTYGRVSRYGIIAMASSFDTIGHFTKTVKDNAYVYEITAGKDPLDASSVDVPVPVYTKQCGQSVRGMKVGLPKEYFEIQGMQKEVRAIVMEAIKQLETLGAHVTEVSLPHTQYAMASYYILVPSEVSSNLSRYDGIRYGHVRDIFGNEAKRRIIMGTHELSSGYYNAYYRKATQVRTLIKKDFTDAFAHVDVIATPVSPTVPFQLGEKIQDPLAMYLSDIFLCPVNLAGVPALSVPCGFTEGLPVGLQLIAPQFQEGRLYQAGYAYEQQTCWYRKGPGNGMVKGKI